jgi:hypothetical protein
METWTKRKATRQAQGEGLAEPWVSVAKSASLRRTDRFGPKVAVINCAGNFDGTKGSLPLFQSGDVYHLHTQGSAKPSPWAKSCNRFAVNPTGCQGSGPPKIAGKTVYCLTNPSAGSGGYRMEPTAKLYNENLAGYRTISGFLPVTRMQSNLRTITIFAKLLVSFNPI